MRGGNKPTPTALTVIQGGIRDAVPPPKGLPADAHSDWEVITADLVGRRLLNDAMLSVVEVYCYALWQVRECSKAIAEYGVFVKGTGGVPKANPASTMMQKAQETVSRLSVELGLTPSSRNRRGLNGSAAGNEDESDAAGV